MKSISFQRRDLSGCAIFLPTATRARPACGLSASTAVGRYICRINWLSRGFIAHARIWRRSGNVVSGRFAGCVHRIAGQVKLAVAHNLRAD